MVVTVITLGELIGIAYLYDQTGEDFSAELNRHREMRGTEGTPDMPDEISGDVDHCEEDGVDIEYDEVGLSQ